MKKIKFIFILFFILSTLGGGAHAAITPAGTLITTEMVTINYDVFEVTQDIVVTAQVQPIYGLEISPTAFAVNLVTTSNQVVSSVNIVNKANTDQVVTVNNIFSNINWNLTAYVDENNDGVWQQGTENISFTTTFNVPMQSSINILLVITANVLNASVFQTTQFDVFSDGGAYIGFNNNTYGDLDQRIFTAGITLNVVFNANNFGGVATPNGIDTHDGSVTLSWDDPGNFPGTQYTVSRIISGVPTIIYTGPLTQFFIASLPDRTTQDFLIQASYQGVTTDYSVTVSVYLPDATIDLPPATASSNYEMTTSGLLTYSEGTTPQVSVSIDAVALGLDLNEADFSSIMVTRDATGSFYISVPSDSALAIAVNSAAASGSPVAIPITVSGGGPLITLDTGSGPYTINQYNQVLDKEGIDQAYQGRLAAFSFNQALNTVYFEVTHFSTYGFANIVTINMSPADVTISVGTTTSITVNVLDDSLSPPVQGAPVTINIISGTGSFIGSTTGTTNANGDINFVFQAGTAPGEVEIKAEAGFITSTQSVFVHVLPPDIVYVSVTGNNANPGTLVSPFATIEYAYTQVATAGIIYMLPGTHTIATTVELSKSLSIVGYDTSANTIVTTNSTRHFTVTNNFVNELSITINNLTLTGGSVTGTSRGGSILVLSDSNLITINILSSIVSGNRAGNSGFGGAIGNDGEGQANVFIRNSLFKNNRSNRGAAISGSNFRVYDSLFIDNRATVNGGVCSDGFLYLENTVVANNASNSGASIGFNCEITANNTVFYNNLTLTGVDSTKVLFGGDTNRGHATVNYSILDETTILLNPNYARVHVFNSFVYNNTTSANADVSGNYHYEQRFIQFASTPNNNFSLSGASHLIDLGGTTIAVTNDASGIARPIYQRQDMGAFEFQGLTVINMEPILYQTAVPVSTNITFNVVSALSEVITASITATVNGVNVANGSFTFTSTANGVQAVYDPPTDFPGLTQIPVTINAQDTSGNSVQKMYVFTTGIAPASGPIAFNISHVPIVSYNTIAQAVADATPNDTIVVTPGIHYLTQQVTIDKSLSIRGYTEVGGTSANVVIDGSGLTRIFLVTENNSVTMSHLTIQNAHLNGIDRSNADTSWGAGILFKGSQIMISNIRGLNNIVPTGSAGFLYVTSNSLVSIVDSYFYGNQIGSVTNNTDGMFGGVFAAFGSISLNIQNSQFVSNSVLGMQTAEGGAIYFAEGTANIQNSQFISNRASLFGGAMIFAGTLGGNVYLENNIVSNNFSTYGGGISFGGVDDGGVSFNAVIFNNTFAFNSATIYGGGLLGLEPTVTLNRNLFMNNSAANGSGLTISEANFVLFNNVFRNNTATSAGGAFAMSQSTVNAQFNTYYGNTASGGAGAIYAVTVNVNIKNDIYYGNTAPIAAQVYFDANTVGTFNISYSLMPDNEEPTQSLGTNFGTGPGNVTGNPVFVNAPVGNLQLGASSPLSVREGATTNVLVTTDYNGNPRTVPYSMGAFEFDGLVPIAFNQTKGMLPYNTIIEAVEAASANDVIVITANTISQPTYIEAGTVTINKNLTLTSITGVSTSVLIDGNNDHRIFIVTDNASVTISAITIQNGFVSADVGAGINLINGYLYINSVIASNNRALNDSNSFGGFLSASTSGNAIINNSLFVNNRAFVGGALFGIGNNLVVSGSVFNGNFADYAGGAAAMTWTIGDPTFITFNNNIVSGNTAGSYGGALYLGKDTGSGDYSEFQAMIQNNLFYTNSAVAGGAIMGYFGTKTIVNNIFVSNNAATSFGGAMVLVNRANTQFNTYYGNTAAQGGAVYAGSEVVMQNEIFNNNSATTGNQIRVFASPITISYSIVPTGDTNDVSGYSFTTVPGNITGNPVFVDAANGNFNLQSGSPAIGAATDNVLVTTDYTGATRTLPYDMGAFEFTGGVDNVSPSIFAINPTINATNVPTNSAITIVVTDNNSVSLSSLIVTINNVLAVNNGVTQNGYLLATTVTTNGYQFIISTSNHYSYGSTVTVNVSAQDVSNNLANLTYAFFIEATPNLTVTQSIQLVPGYNLIGFYVSVNMTASQLSDLIVNQGGGVELIYGPVSGGYIFYYPDFGFDDFNVTTSIGVIVKATTASTLEVNGVLRGPVVNYQLNPGYNFITLPYRSNGNEYTASQIGNQITLDGGLVELIYGHRPNDQAYTYYYPDFGFDEFTASNNIMLIIKTNNSSSSNFTVAP